MKNIIFLVVIILTVAIAVSCNIQNKADKEGKTETVSTKQADGSKTTSEVFKKVMVKDNEDVLHRIEQMETSLNEAIEGISVNVDNTQVLTRLEEIKANLNTSAGELLLAVNKRETGYKSQLNQVLAAVMAAFAALLLTMLIAYRYLKKFIAECMIIYSGKENSSPLSPETVPADTDENPVLKSVNSVYTALDQKIAENKIFFDPEKAVKLDSSSKALLAEINAESAFLKKAGVELPEKYLYLMALEKVNEKNYSDASVILEAVKKSDDQFSPGFFLAGYIAYVSRKYDTALENLEKACEIEPENPAYLISYGNACLKEKKYAEASKALAKAVELKPEDASTWNNLAHSYIVDSKTEEAVEAFSKAAELRPDFHEALHNLGLALGKLGRYEEALSAFENAVKAKEDKHESLYNAACVYALLGKRDGALSNLKKAIALNPDYAGKAAKDKDFASFKDDAEFKEITG